MAAGEAPQRQPGSPKRPETDHRDIGVLRAGGQVKALGRAEGVENGRDDRLVGAEGDADGETGWGFGHFGTAYLSRLI